MMQVPIIQTNRCSLSAVSRNDIPVLLQIVNDAETRRFMPDFCEVFHTVDSLNTFIDSFDHYSHGNQGFLWGIRLQENLIGFIGIMDIPDSCTLFYAMHPGYRKYGYLKESLTEVIRFINDNDLCPTIHSEVFADNYISQKVLTEMGVSYVLRERN